MALTKLELQNFTVFSDLKMDFSPGLNVLIGENGIGKTHIMKVLYSACQAAQAQSTALKFNQKLVRVFRPDNLRINRLVKRGGGAGTRNTTVSVSTKAASLNLRFHSKSKDFDAEITGEQIWEKQSSSLISTYIPSKEILSNARKLPYAIDQSIVAFDDTYKDIIQMAGVGVLRGRETLLIQKYADILRNFGALSVDISDEAFYLKQGNQAKFEFNLVSEGIRKIALLWQLVKNGTFAKGSVLFWDEPEANINPKHIPVLVEMLLELQLDGVQVFVATHDYIFAKYIEVLQKDDTKVLFHSLYRENGAIEVEHNHTFRELKPNPIITAYDKLLHDVFDKRIGD